MNPVQSRKPSSEDRIKGLVAELRKLQDIIDSHADRIQELEANERAYEAALGERTYNEVAAHIRELEAALQLARNRIYYLGVATGVNQDTFLPQIDAAIQRTEP